MERLYDYDSSLLERIERRDENAIALLYDRYAAVVFSVALRVSGNRASAEQVLATVFSEVWRTPARFLRMADSLAASMALIARTKAAAMLPKGPVGVEAPMNPYALTTLQRAS